MREEARTAQSPKVGQKICVSAAQFHPWLPFKTQWRLLFPTQLQVATWDRFDVIYDGRVAAPGSEHLEELTEPVE
jgi:hypothetical protein